MNKNHACWSFIAFSLLQIHLTQSRATGRGGLGSCGMLSCVQKASLTSSSFEHALCFPSFVHAALCTLLSEEQILRDAKSPQLPLVAVPGVLFRVNEGSRRQLVPWLVPARRDPLGLVCGKYVLVPQVQTSCRCEWSSVLVESDGFGPTVSRL